MSDTQVLRLAPRWAIALVALLGGPLAVSAQDEGEGLRERYRLPVPGVPEVAGLIVASDRDIGPGLGRPTARALSVFLGATYHRFTRYNEADHDGQGILSVGLGDPAGWVAVRGDILFYSTLRSGLFERMGLNLQISRVLIWDLLLSAGWENVLTRGANDIGESHWASLSRWFTTDSRGWLDAVGISVGVGDGRFVKEDDWFARRTDRLHPFGTVAVRVAWPLTALGSWESDDLYLAAALTPFRGVPLVITPGVADVTGRVGNGARFVVSGGYLFRVPIG